jgi:hypothetical protein
MVPVSGTTVTLELGFLGTPARVLGAVGVRGDAS